MKKNIHWEMLFWCGPNLLLPLTPLALKIIINIFSIYKMPISDSPELILYSFFSCLIFLKMIDGGITYFEKFLQLCISIWLIVDISILFLIYTKTNNSACENFAVISAILVPLISIIYKYYLLIKSFSEGDGHE